MPFTVEDFQDLLRLLDQHPEWLAELRRRLLTDELLELPELVRRLGEQLVILTARVDALADAQLQTEQRLARTELHVERLTAEVGGLRGEVGGLRGEVGGLRGEVGGLRGEVGGLRGEVGGLRGEAMEQRYRARAGAYFSFLARRLRVLDPGRLADRLDDALDSGVLDAAERSKILLADLVLTGRRREDGAEIYLLAEISGVIDPHDVARAAERAALLAKLGYPVVPIVAGQAINPEAVALAQQQGVRTVLDGHDASSAAASPGE